MEYISYMSDPKQEVKQPPNNVIPFRPGIGESLAIMRIVVDSVFGGYVLRLVTLQGETPGRHFKSREELLSELNKFI